MAGVKPPSSSLLTPDLESAGVRKNTPGSTRQFSGRQAIAASVAVAVILGSTFAVYRSVVPPRAPEPGPPIGESERRTHNSAFRNAPNPERFEQIQTMVRLTNPLPDATVSAKAEKLVVMGHVRSNADLEAAREIAQGVAKDLALPLEFSVNLNFINDP